MAEPYIDRLNVVARFRERKQGRNILLFGRDTDADANARSNARSPFDGDLLIHGDVMVRSDPGPFVEARARLVGRC
jgi:actin-related protein 5